MTNKVNKPTLVEKKHTKLNLNQQAVVYLQELLIWKYIWLDTVVNSAAQNSSDNLPSYLPDNRRMMLFVGDVF